MIARLGAGEGQDGGRKEHGLVVRVGNQQADALVLQRGEAGLNNTGRVDVQAWQDDRNQRGEIDALVHGWWWW